MLITLCGVSKKDNFINELNEALNSEVLIGKYIRPPYDVVGEKISTTLSSGKTVHLTLDEDGLIHTIF